MEGNRIREIRKKRGLSLKRMAELLSALGLADLHFTTIGKIERGEVSVTVETLRRFAALLDVSVLELISEEAGPGPGRVPVVTLPRGAIGPEEAVVTGYTEPFRYSKRAFMVSSLLSEFDPSIEPEAQHDSVLVDPEDDELVDGRLYLVMGEGGEHRVRRLREKPLRFEAADASDTTKYLRIGKDPFRVIGGVTIIDPKWQFVRGGDVKLRWDTPIRLKREPNLDS